MCGAPSRARVENILFIVQPAIILARKRKKRQDTMMYLLNARDADFLPRLDKALIRGSSHEPTIIGIVSSIIEAVRQEGDTALKRYTQQFDRHTGDLKISRAALEQAAALCPVPVREALEKAAARISAFHALQHPDDKETIDSLGVRSGWRWEALGAVGLYVPGGRASYPSSVLMNALPAKIAGVERLVVTVPTPEGYLSPAVAAALLLSNVDEVYAVGGAQAVAALAFGTISIAPVVKIVGPGNAYVAEAKRQVFGKVGIDSIAGPSEVCIISDASTPAAWLAADLLAQAEHDPDAQSIIIATDHGHLQAVVDAVAAQLPLLATRAVAQASWDRHGLAILVPSLADAIPVAARIAPEHLELSGPKAEALFPQVRCAGSIFLGAHTPEALGDYCAGPNHVLPTSGAARYASGLGVTDFMRRATFLHCPAGKAFAALAGIAIPLAEAEGLPGHGGSVGVRG
jgi:histidinol dehydrogenase